MQLEPNSSRADFAGIHALQSRAAGYSVAAKCLEVQAEAEVRNPELRGERRTQLADEAWSWYQGALGEIHVGALLEKLGPAWFVRHSVPIGAGTTDVDHLLIGPAGVFTLNTKHHRNQPVWVGDYVLRVNNVNQPHLRNSAREAENVKNRLAKASGLSVEVKSVIVLVGTSSLSDSRAPETRTTSVVPEHLLIGWIESLAPTLDAGAMGLLRLAAEDPSTWHVDPRAAETLRVMQRFDRLRTAVGSSMPQPSPTTRARKAPRNTTYEAPFAKRPAAATGRQTSSHPRRSSGAAINLLKALAAFAFAGVIIAFYPQVVAVFTAVFNFVSSVSK